MDVYTRTIDETKILPIFKEQTIFLGDSLMNDQQLKALNQDGKPLLKAVDDLLYFRVVESGRSWCVRYKLPGQKRSPINIGRYGKGEGRLSISEARIEAAKIKAIIRNGEDPILLKKRTQIASFKTVNEVAEDYLAHYCKTIENPHIPQRIYRKEIAPSIGELPFAAIAWLEELKIYSNGAEYVFPCRKEGAKRPHISADTLNHALAKMFGMKVDSNKNNYEDHLGKAGISHWNFYFRRTLYLTCNRNLYSIVNTLTALSQAPLTTTILKSKGWKP